MAKGVKGSSPTEDIPQRTTMIIKPSIIYKLKRIALDEKTTQTALAEEALTVYIKNWEKKNGEIKI